MAVASTAGHVTCFRLITPLEKSETLSGELGLAGGVLGSVAAEVDGVVEDSPGSSVVELELLSTLHVPFSTPPRVLKFGHSFQYQVHCIVLFWAHANHLRSSMNLVIAHVPLCRCICKW